SIFPIPSRYISIFRAPPPRYFSPSLISVGAYVAGGDPETDLAIARFPVMRQFLRQGLDESESLAESRARLASLLAGGQA
ncbi:hypothetical protein ACLHXP_04150, partial [Pseudomonas aeruginosa]